MNTATFDNDVCHIPELGQWRFPDDAASRARQFPARLRKFVAAAQALVSAHYAANSYRNPPAIKADTWGVKRVRILREGPGERSAYCFVDIATGDVLKAASWMSPAKHARSNIWDDDVGVSGLTPYGARYL
jgi:hypothetical protein